MTIVQLVPPVWLSVSLLGVIWTVASFVVSPPRVRQIPPSILGGVGGAALGQIVGDRLGLGDPLLGDAHFAGITIGALLAIVVVRRFAA